MSLRWPLAVYCRSCCCCCIALTDSIWLCATKEAKAGGVHAPRNPGTCRVAEEACAARYGPAPVVNQLFSEAVRLVAPFRPSTSARPHPHQLTSAPSAIVQWSEYGTPSPRKTAHQCAAAVKQSNRARCLGHRAPSKGCLGSFNRPPCATLFREWHGRDASSSMCNARRSRLGAWNAGEVGGEVAEQANEVIHPLFRWAGAGVWGWAPLLMYWYCYCCTGRRGSRGQWTRGGPLGWQLNHICVKRAMSDCLCRQTVHAAKLCARLVGTAYRCT
jgi:hypothetical protein